MPEYDAITPHSGPECAMSMNNYDDLLRFGVAPPGSVEWAQNWIQERMRLDGPVGVLEYTKHGFFFDIFKPYPQPFLPIRVLQNPICRFSNLYVKIESIPLEILEVRDCYFSDICCFGGIQTISENELIPFVKFVEDSLRDGGNLLLSYTKFINCDKESKEILKKSFVLMNINKHLSNETVFDSISNNIAKIELKNREGTQIIDLLKDTNSSEKIYDTGVVLQNVKEIFRTNFSSQNFKYLDVSTKVKSSSIGLWFSKYSPC